MAYQVGFVGSAARTTSGQSGSLPLHPLAESLSVAIDVTTTSGTPSLTLSVEWSQDGATWFVADPADAFTAITAAGKKVKAFATKGRFARLAWAITGGTPSLTFSCDVGWVDRPGSNMV